MTTNTPDDRYLATQLRGAVRMVRDYRHNPTMRRAWLERVADYRECLIDRMRRRQGWTLAERVAGGRRPAIVAKLQQSAARAGLPKMRRSFIRAI